MNNIRFWIGGAALAFLLLFATACDCDDPTDPSCSNYCQDETDPLCPNYDACWDRSETSADFLIYEPVSSLTFRDLWEPYDTDTIAGTEAEFIALDTAENNEYTWYIGASTYHSRSVYLKGFPLEEDIPISLVVQKPRDERDQECFPNDNGRDSSTRIMHAANKISFRGVYEGLVEGIPEKVEVSVYFDSVYRRPTGRTFRGFFEGLPPVAECRFSNSLGGGGAGGFRRMLGAPQGHFLDNAVYICGGRIEYEMWSPAENDSLYIRYKLYRVLPDNPQRTSSKATSYFFRGKRKP